jgi:hypothetical protein
LFPCKKNASFLALKWKKGLTMILKKNYKPINQPVFLFLAISKKGRLGIGQKHWISGHLKAVKGNRCQTINGAIKGEEQGRLDGAL